MNNEKRGERRAETAREHDDSDILETTLPTPGQQGRAGGDLQTDIGTQAEAERVNDPQAHGRRTKEDEIAHNERGQPEDAG